ncbi:hypothetical protein CXG46_09265 [Nocardioides alpinus]|nr:hypothetical protein CXG46_09265 [Nocardioides alpinus]
MRVLTGLVLVASGVLLHLASWQRWAGHCPWGSQQETAACNQRMDHLYDFLFIGDPWVPVGKAAELAGLSLLLVALALILLPWATSELWPGPGITAGLALSALVLANVGLATRRSGLAGEVVEPALESGGFMLLWVPSLVLTWVAVRARGWVRAGSIFLVLGSPLVAAFTYAIGPFDAAPWWEAYSGDLTAMGGLCLLVAAVRRPARKREPAAEAATVA